jgi:DNA-binding transcriptional LysR family regulator
VPRPAQLSIDLLETFVALIRNDGDTTKAARILDINQPSLSKRLAFLQHSGKVLQRPWLKRSGKTWELSAEGSRVLPAVRELLDRYQILTDFTNAPRPEPVGLRFACGQTSGAFLVRRAMANLGGFTPTSRSGFRPCGRRKALSAWLREPSTWR